MKKHVLLAAALCMTAVMATACGSKHTQTQETAAETTTEASDAETKAADTTKPDLSNVDPKMAEGPGAFETDESSEGVQVEEISGEELAKLQSEVAAKLEKTDYKSYAKELVEIVKSKDMEGLADHIDFPAFISCVKTNGGMVDTKEDFMKLTRLRSSPMRWRQRSERWMLIPLNRLWQESFWAMVFRISSSALPWTENLRSQE